MSKKYAFSLVEISVVIVIIGILISGISEGISLYKDIRITSARSVTNNSRIGRIPDLMVWLETTSERSFDINDTVDNKEIKNWFDINPQASTKIKITSVANSFPKYKKYCINNIPCLSFDGVNDYLDVETFSSNISKLSFFVVVVTNNLNTDPYCCIGLIMSVSNSTDWVNGDVHYQFGRYNSSINYDLKTLGGYNSQLRNIIKLNNNYIFSIIDNNSRVDSYINGIVQGTKYEAGGSSNFIKNLNRISLASWKISTGRSRHLSGNIGEVIIFGRDLNTSERREVETYLSKKWSIKLDG